MRDHSEKNKIHLINSKVINSEEIMYSDETQKN